MNDLNDGYISELSVRLSNAETEIERLHGVQKTLQAIADETVASNGRLRAEIERLKAALRDALCAWQESRDLDERQILAALEGRP